MKGRIVFRGSANHPYDKFREGFSPRNPRGEIQIQPGGQMIGGVSTSKDIGSAIRYAANYEGWIYVAFLTKGVDVLEHMIAKSKKSGGDKYKKGIPNALTQAEIAALSVDKSELIAARRCRVVNDMAEMFGPVFPNLYCKVPDSAREEGFKWLETQITVPKEYDKH
jgi:hypothetical protein